MAVVHAARFTCVVHLEAAHCTCVQTNDCTANTMAPGRSLHVVLQMLGLECRVAQTNGVSALCVAATPELVVSGYSDGFIHCHSRLPVGPHQAPGAPLWCIPNAHARAHACGVTALQLSNRCEGVPGGPQRRVPQPLTSAAADECTFRKSHLPSTTHGPFQMGLLHKSRVSVRAPIASDSTKAPPHAFVCRCDFIASGAAGGKQWHCRAWGAGMA